MSQKTRDLIAQVIDNLAAECQVPARILRGESVVKAAVLGVQNVNPAMSTIDELRQQLADVSHERDLLRDLLAKIRSNLSVLPKENWWIHGAIDDVIRTAPPKEASKHE